MTASDIADILRHHRFQITNEKACQAQIEATLIALLPLGTKLSREHRLGAGDIPDFMIDGDVALEIKARGATAASALRQLERYAAHGEVRELILAYGGRALEMPATVGGKPLISVGLREGLAVNARTYGQLSFSDGRWVLDKLEPHVVIKLKAVFPKIPKYERRRFQFPDDLATAADLAWFISRYPMAPENGADGRLAARVGDYHAEQAELGSILAPDYRPPSYAGLQPGCEVRPYQAAPVEVLNRTGGLLVGDEVGLGKTYLTAWACLAGGALPAAIVCHAHLQRQWCAVIEAFTTLKAHAVRGTKPYVLPPADVRVFRYTQLIGWADVLPTLGTGLVAFDEIQELRHGRDTGKGKAAARLVEASRRVLGLSATPIYNYGSEFWNILQFVRPDVLGDYDDFYREWCSGGQVSDPKALGTLLRERHAFIRRTKADVGQFMAPVNRLVDVIDYDQAEMRSIDDLAEQLAIRATTGEFTERGEATRMLDLRVRHATGVAKAKAVAQVARIMVEGGTPIVLVGWHRDVYSIWLEALADLKPALYTGSETAASKNLSAKAFMDGDTDLLILSLRSGAGLDGLQRRCSTMLFGELDWSPGIHHQCIGRLDREGQQEPVTAIFLVCEDGSDPPMMEVLGLKASQSAAILDPTLGVQRVHSDGEGMKRLIQRYLTKTRAPKVSPRKVVSPTGETLGVHHIEALKRLATFPNGTGGLGGVMSGAVLASLKMLGLADPVPEDRIGGGRWIINDAGRDLLLREGIGPDADLARSSAA